MTKVLLTASLSELSALEDMGSFSDIVIVWSGHSQCNAVKKSSDSRCNWGFLLGRACTKKGNRRKRTTVAIRDWDEGCCSTREVPL